jgi:hypothetical protein
MDKLENLLKYYSRGYSISECMYKVSEENLQIIQKRLVRYNSGTYFEFIYRKLNFKQMTINNHLKIIGNYFLSLPFDERISELERWYLMKYEKANINYKTMPKSIKKDNSIWSVNGSEHQYSVKMRVPSKKRSKRVWKNFERLFPNYKK